MEFLFALPLILIPLALPLMSGYMAARFGRSFWLWFWLSLPLPLISCFIILCLPDKSVHEDSIGKDSIFSNNKSENSRT